MTSPAATSYLNKGLILERNPLQAENRAIGDAIQNRCSESRANGSIIVNPSIGRKLPLILAAVIAFGLPLVVRSATYLHILTLLYLYAYLTTSWNLVGGFAGVLPLGHAAFVGIGAYTSTVLSLQYGLSPWIGMLIGAVLASIVGVIIGLPTFKMRLTVLLISLNHLTCQG